MLMTLVFMINNQSWAEQPLEFSKNKGFFKFFLEVDFLISRGAFILSSLFLLIIMSVFDIYIYSYYSLGRALKNKHMELIT